jgi:hypothetical protein
VVLAVVGFQVRKREDLSADEVVPTVDGRELADLVHAFELGHGMETRPASYGGLIPAFFNFGSMANHFLGRGEAGKVALLGCECGEWGCWPLLATITVTQQRVVWTDFEQPHRKERDYTALGPFEFDRAQYELALSALPVAGA